MLSGILKLEWVNQFDFSLSICLVWSVLLVLCNFMWQFSRIRSQQYDQKNCVAMGWGKHKFGDEGFYQTSLKQVKMDIVSNSRCQNQLRATSRLSNTWTLHESFLCAGGEEGRDLCTGDGGGPLVCPMLANPKR